MKVKFNLITRRFSLEGEEFIPVVDDGTSEPTDYLNGTPATVLDLKDPIFKYDPDPIDEEADWWDNSPDPDIRNYFEGGYDREGAKENLNSIVNNLNKESAINHYLNESGSTDYDLSGERSRTEFGASQGRGSLAGSYAEPKESNENESLGIGIHDDNDYGFYINHDAADVISHELGHLNDYNANENISYRNKLTDDEWRNMYGNKFIDAYNTFNAGDNLTDDENDILVHDKTPFEVYADAASLRSALFKSGAWNGQEPITEDMIDDYLKSEREYRSAVGANNDIFPDLPNINYGSSPQRLANYFSLDKIVELLNSSRKFSDTELQELDQYGKDLPEGDLSTVDTKEFIGVKEPNRPFHRTSFKYGK